MYTHTHIYTIYRERQKIDSDSGGPITSQVPSYVFGGVVGDGGLHPLPFQFTSSSSVILIITIHNILVSLI